MTVKQQQLIALYAAVMAAKAAARIAPVTLSHLEA
jgi:hypothetical protein